MQVGAADGVMQIEEPAAWQWLAPEQLVVLPKTRTVHVRSFPPASVLKSNDVSITRVLRLAEETLLLEALHPRFQRFVRFEGDRLPA
jgi:hypothetical protein